MPSLAKVQRDQCSPVLERGWESRTASTGERKKNWFGLFGGQFGLSTSILLYVPQGRNSIDRNLAYRNTHMHKNICTRIFNVELCVISRVKKRNNSQTGRANYTWAHPYHGWECSYYQEEWHRMKICVAPC